MSKVESTAVGGRKVITGIGLLLAVVALFAVGLAILRPRPDPEVLAQRARDAFMAKQYGEAEADLNQVLTIRKPTPLDTMLQAQLWMVKGQNEKALESLEQIPDDHPMAAQARVQAGQLELRRNRFAKAETLFLQALKIDPKMERPRRELIFIYGMQLRRPELNACFRALSEIAPLTYSEAFLWSLSRGVSWEAAEIVETLKKCLVADPDDRWARLGMAEGLRELSRFDEAEAALAPLPATDPAALAIKVRIALDRGDSQAVDTLLENAPTGDVELSLLQGRFALARGDGAEAVRQFKFAHDAAPTLRESVLGLGQALQNVGDKAAAPLLEEARMHERLGTLVQKAAVETNRNDPILMKDLGAACADLGRLQEARAWYNLAVAKDPLDTQAQEGLTRVKDRLNQLK